MTQSICFIGAGNMAGSLIGGLLANGYPAGSITACDIDAARLRGLQEEFGIATETDGPAAAKVADIVVLAVKPQVMPDACRSLATLPADAQRLFISIAAGVPADAIDGWLGGGRAIVRCMPNTPALLQLGATGLAANPRVSDAQKSTAEQILQAVGICLWVAQESDLDAVTAVSGSGPAYFFYFIELLEAAGIKLGLEPETSARLARQTALGAATMAIGRDVAELRAQVTSKKGTTEQAILSLQANQLERLVDEATAAACRRARELAIELTAQQEN